MYITPQYSRPPYGQKEDPETGYTCSICHYDVKWWDDTCVEDGKGRFFHKKCLAEKIISADIDIDTE